MRREAAAVLLTCLLLTPSFGADDAAADGPDDPDDLDADLDLGDIDDLGDEGFDDGDPDAGGQGGFPEVDDFDLGMPETDRKKQMEACLIHTTNRVQARREQMEQTIKEIMSSPQGQQMEQNQAMNTLMFSWMMTCYLNIDRENVKQAVKTGEISDEVEQEIFAPKADRPQQVNSASARQWELLQSVLRDEEIKHREMQDTLKKTAREQQQRQQQQSMPQAPPRVDVIGSGMSGQSQALYVLGVFGTLFGLGACAVMKLSKDENAARDKRSGKAKKEGKKGR